MVKSKEVIDYLKKNLDISNCVSIFTAGSFPKELLPQTDLDIFIVIDENKKQEFFENLTDIMDKYVSSKSEITYSLFRGPIKFKKEGLVHFGIYTESNIHDQENKELFVNAPRLFLKSLIKTARIIHGKTLKDLLKDIDLNDAGTIKKNAQRSSNKMKTLKEKEYIDFPEWKKTPEGWKLLRKKLKTDGFLKDYLMKYFSKHLV